MLRTLSANWFPLFDVGCAALACSIWLFRPQIGLLPLLIGLLPWLIRLLTVHRISIATPFDIPLVVFMLTAGIAVWTSFYRPAASEKLWLIVGAILLFYSFANWSVISSEESGRIQSWLLAIAGAATSIYFLVSHDWNAYPPKFMILSNLGPSLQSFLPIRNLATFHPNVMAAVLAVLMPFSAAAVSIEWRIKKGSGLTFLSLLLFIIVLFGLLLTTARGAWIALSVGIILVGWWWVTGQLPVRQKRNRKILFIGIPVTFIVLLVIGLVWIAKGWIDLVEWLPDTEASLLRMELYLKSLTLLNDYFAFGAGLDSFMMQYSSYALLSHVGFSTHSHNLYIDVVIEQGIVALLSLLWMWLLAGEAILRLLSDDRSNQSSETETYKVLDNHQETLEKSVAIDNQGITLGAAGISLLVLILSGLVDDAIYNSRAVILFFLPLAFTVPQLKNMPVLARRKKLGLVSLVVGLVLMAVIVWWRPITSRFISNLAAVRQSQIELGLYSWPEYPIQDAVRRQVDLEQVIAGYERAMELDSSNASANRRLGQIELSLGRYEAALEHLTNAYEIFPGDNATRQLLGEALIVSGHVEAGRKAWQGINQEQNQLALREYWYSYLGDSLREGAIHEARITISSHTE